MASRPRALLGLKSARIRYATSPASPAAPAGCPWPRSAVPGHRHLTEFGPVVLGDRDVDDPGRLGQVRRQRDRKSTRLNSSHVAISYAVFCLKKKKKYRMNNKATEKKNCYHTKRTVERTF